MTSASVGFHCPECAKGGAQKVYTRASLARLNRPIVTQVLIAINAVRVPDRPRARRGVRDRLRPRSAKAFRADRSPRRGRRGRVVPDHHRRVPPRQPRPPALQHAGAVQHRQRPRARPRASPLRRPVLHVADVRFVRRPAHRPERADRRRVGSRVRPPRCHGHRPAPRRHRPVGERARARDRHQPGPHVLDPGHLDRRAPRRARRRAGRRLGRCSKDRGCSVRRRPRPRRSSPSAPPPSPAASSSSSDLGRFHLRLQVAEAATPARRSAPAWRPEAPTDRRATTGSGAAPPSRGGCGRAGPDEASGGRCR